VNCLDDTNLRRCSISPAQAQSFESLKYKIYYRKETDEYLLFMS
jgi:hypothetical protein